VIAVLQSTSTACSNPSPAPAAAAAAAAAAGDCVVSKRLSGGDLPLQLVIRVMMMMTMAARWQHRRGAEVVAVKQPLHLSLSLSHLNQPP